MNSHKGGGGGGGRERGGGKSSNQSQSSNQSHAKSHTATGQSVNGNNSNSTKLLNNYQSSNSQINGNKSQPSENQLYLASLSADKSGIDSEMAKKIEEISTMTGRTIDDTWMALHDCDNDVHRAVDLLLEGGHDEQSEWQDVCKKKKAAGGQKSGQQDRDTEEQRQRGGDDGTSRQRSNQTAEFGFGFESSTNSDSHSSRRSKIPPRFTRGRGKSVGGMLQTDDRAPGQGGGGMGGGGGPIRTQDRRRGGARSRGSSMGAMRSQPRFGQESGGFTSDAGPTNIETWNTEFSTAQQDSFSTVGSWGDTVEELERAEATSKMNGNPGASHSTDGAAVGGSRRPADSSKIAPHRPGEGRRDPQSLAPGGVRGDPQSLAPGGVRGGTSLMGLLNPHGSASSSVRPGDQGQAWSSQSSHSASQTLSSVHPLIAPKGALEVLRSTVHQWATFSNIITRIHPPISRSINRRIKINRSLASAGSTTGLASAGSTAVSTAGSASENQVIINRGGFDLSKLFNLGGSGGSTVQYGNIINHHQHAGGATHHQHGATEPIQRLHQPPYPSSAVVGSGEREAYSQYAKEATECIKNAVGIGGSSSNNVNESSSSSSGTSSRSLHEQQQQQQSQQLDIHRPDSQQKTHPVKLPVSAAADQLHTDPLVKDSSRHSADVTAVSAAGGWDTSRRSNLSFGFTGSLGANIQSAIGQYPGQNARPGFSQQSVSSLESIQTVSANQPTPIGQPTAKRLTLEDLGLSTSTASSSRSNSAQHNLNYNVNPTSYSQLSYNQSGNIKHDSVPTTNPIGYRSAQGSSMLTNQLAVSSGVSSDISTPRKLYYDGTNFAGGSVDGYTAVDSSVVAPLTSAAGVNFKSVVGGTDKFSPSIVTDPVSQQGFDRTYPHVGGMYGMGNMYGMGGVMPEPSGSGLVVGDAAIVGAYLNTDGGLGTYQTMFGDFNQQVVRPAEYQGVASEGQSDKISAVGSAMSKLSVGDVSASTQQQQQQTKESAVTVSTSAVKSLSSSSSVASTGVTAISSVNSTAVSSLSTAASTAAAAANIVSASTAAEVSIIGAADGSMYSNQSYYMGQQPPGFQPIAPAVTVAAVNPATIAAYGGFDGQTGYGYDESQLLQQQQTLSMTNPAAGGFYDLTFNQALPGMPLPNNASMDAQQMTALTFPPPPGVISNTMADLKLAGMNPLMSGLVPGLQPAAVNQAQQPYGAALQQPAAANQAQQQPYGSALQQPAAVNQAQQQQQQTYSMYPPGYSYYYPNSAGVPAMMGSYYAPPMIPMNNVPVTLMGDVGSSGGVSGGGQKSASVLYGSSVRPSTTYRVGQTGPVGGEDYTRSHMTNHRPISNSTNMTGIPMAPFDSGMGANYVNHPSSQAVQQKLAAAAVGGASSRPAAAAAYNPAPAGRNWNAK